MPPALLCGPERQDCSTFLQEDGENADAGGARVVVKDHQGDYNIIKGIIKDVWRLAGS